MGLGSSLYSLRPEFIVVLSHLSHSYALPVLEKNNLEVSSESGWGGVFRESKIHPTAYSTLHQIGCARLQVKERIYLPIPRLPSLANR